MLSALTIIMLLLSSTLLAAAQQQNVQIQLDSTLQFSISADQIVPFVLNLGDTNETDSDLFFVVQYPPSDPTQEPFMTVSTSYGFVKKCYNADDEFSGVCSIPQQQLDSNMTVDVQVSCKVNCHLIINAFLSRRLKLSLKDTTIFTAPSTHSLPLQIQIQVPLDLIFTQIAMYARIINFQNVTEGLQMYANIGDMQGEQPTAEMYDVEGESTYWGGQGLFFSREYVAPGDWIKVYLYLSEGMQVKFYSLWMDRNTYSIELGKAYFDFTSASEGRIYLLDLLKSSTPTEGKAICIAFIIYGGYPVIDVSFDSGFDQVLTGLNTLGTINYVLTAEQRQAANSSTKIYIRVSSGWNADYYMASTVQEDSYMLITPDMSYYSELQPDEVYNYFFDELIFTSENNEIVRTYSIKVDIISGKGTFGVRRCRPYEQGATLSACVVSLTNELTNPTLYDTFKQIKTTIKNTSSYVNVIFKYNLSLCEPIGNISSPIGYYCSFQIIGANFIKQPIDYIMSLNKRKYAGIIREGSTIKDLLFKDEYLYFKLGLSTLEEVVSITVFVTVIEGGVYLFGSTKEQYPTFDTDIHLIKSSSANTLVYLRDQIAKNIYITVYGLQFSEFTIGVIVNREKIGGNSTANSSTNGSGSVNSSSSKVGLQLDLTQEFSMQQNDTNATFTIQTHQPLNITVEVIQLVGTVSMQIMDPNNIIIACRNSTISTTKLTCSLTVEAGIIYNVNILASRGATKKFIILYHKEQNCIPYSLNKPLFVELAKGQSGCSIFSITKLTSLEVTTSVSLLQVLSQSLIFSVCIEEHCLQQVTSHHQTISKGQLSSFCQLGSDKTTQNSCMIKLSYSANNQSSMHFSVIVEEQGKDIGLFDGIVQKINNYELSQTNGKHFYYPIYSYTTLKIIFTSFTRSSYYLAAHFQQESQFFTGKGQIYLPYRQADKLSTDPNINLFETTISSYSKILTIMPDAISKFCQKCVLTVAVYANYDNTKVLSMFEIEITQIQTRLLPGDSKIGYLGQDELYNYQMDGGHNGDAFIYLHDLGKQSSGQKDCFMAQLADFGDNNFISIGSGYTYIKQNDPWANLYITSIADICNYQVTYTLADFPLLTITMNGKQTVNLRSGSQGYYLYYHQSNDSFRIIQEVQTGSSLIFASPISNNQSIQSLMSEDPSTFPFVNTQQLGIFVVDSSSNDFCFNCNYLIVAKGNPSVNSQLLITNLTTSIPLSINGILKQKIKANDPTHWYRFNSITSFNVTISMKHGSLRVKVMDPQNITISDQSISTSTVISVPHSQQNENAAFDVISIRTRYSISVQAFQDTSYSIKASKKNITRRIFEGVPEYIVCQAGTPIVLQFLNLHSPNSSSNGTLNVLADVVESYNNNTLLKLVNSSILFQNENSKSSQSLDLSSSLQSGDTFNWQLPQRLGTYYINFTTSKTVLVLIILAKESIIHLSPSSNAIMQKQAIFELFSGKKSTMIEVFTCWGEIGVDSSHRYLDFTTSQNNNEIIMEQNNYGGHYVISAEDINEEYFIRVFSRKEQSKLGYLIHYHFYDQGDILPYKLIGMLSKDISYTLAPTIITFYFNQININWEMSSSIEKVNVEYRLYISSNRTKIIQYANCRLEEVYIMTADSSNIINDTISFQLDINKVSVVVGGSSTYFVGGQAVVSIISTATASNNYPESMRLIYQVIQLANVAAPVAAASSSSIKLMIMWILLPFAIAGLLLYLSLKYCIKKYRGLLPDEFIQESIDEQSSKKIDNPVDASQSLKEEVT